MQSGVILPAGPGPAIGRGTHRPRSIGEDDYTMKLYFLRHGIAEDVAPPMRDAERKLTEEGIREMEGVGRGMQALDLDFSQILTSPLARARETAEIAARGIGREDRLRVCPELASGCRFGDLQRAVEDFPSGSRVLLVGHEPDLSTLISDLIGGGLVRMKKASLAMVDAYPIEPGAGELRWLLTAEQLCKIGNG